MSNGLAALIAGAYLLAVGVKGNAGKLGAQLAQDRGFIPWAIAFVILWLLYQNTSQKSLWGGLLTIALAAFFIQAGAGLFKNFDAVMLKLKGGQNG